jgi:hypothetical protein
LNSPKQLTERAFENYQGVDSSRSGMKRILIIGAFVVSLPFVSNES